MRPDRLTVGSIAVLTVCSLSAFRDNPRDAYTWVAKGLNAVGIRTYADLREVNVAERPAGWDSYENWSDGWDYEDWSRVKRIDLGGRNLAFADASGAFLANADLSHADLTGAEFGSAQLQGADLSFAQLQGADLSSAQLQGADLSVAQLQGANLSGAHLQGANLRGAQLQGSDLERVQLEGADLRDTNLWRAMAGHALWDLADLRSSSVQPMTDADINALVSEASKGIPDEGRRTATAETLSGALRTEKRSPGPDFPDEWRSEANVMFSPGDPKPEPLDWGRPKWATEQDYDANLGTFLADLACRGDVPEAQTRGLARRALIEATLDGKPERVWHALFANQITDGGCPPAEGLPGDIRRRLEELAAQGATTTASPASTAPPAE
jgi:hypothetical protein